MTLARPLKQKPADIAKELIAAMNLADAGVAEATVAGPGFINFRIAAGSLASSLTKILDEREAFGRSNAGKGEPVNVEFVSANPTGPLHVGHGRQAALGDAIARLLDARGLDGHARVLLQRRRRADQQSGAERAGAPACDCRRAARDSRGRISRRVHPRDRRRAIARSTPAMRAAAISTTCARSR